jgi:hypothetical protein
VEVQAALGLGAEGDRGAGGGVAGVVGATVFTHSLDGTRTEPARFGVTWDVSAGAMTSVEEAAAASSRLRRIDGVGAFSGVVTNDVQIAGTPVTTLFVRPDRGWVGPLITDGHAPNGAEIALGAETMRRLHLHIGDEVPVSVFDGPTARFRVSGRAVLNDSGIEGAITPGKGAAISWSAIPFLAPPGEEIEDPAPQSFLIRFTPGADAAGVTAAIERVFPGSTSPAIVPADLLNLVDVSALPLVLGAALALIGLGAVIHALLGCVTRRRRDIAVLKALGFAGREVRAAVGCQTVVFAAVALAVGVPLGVAAGRVTWSVTAHQLAIVDHPVVPVAALAAACGAFVVGLVVVTLVPARLAARVPATVILRDE